MLDANVAAVLEAAKTLGGVLVGALLTGLAALMRARKERKQAIALALSDLLEVRQRVVVLEEVVQLLKAKVPGIAHAQVNELRGVFDALLPADPQLERRFSDAVAKLASIDLVLAFRLRSQPAAQHIFSVLRTAARQQPAAGEQFAAAFQVLHGTFSAHLDKAVCELATEHSWRTGVRVNKLTRRKAELPPELDELIKQVQVGVADVPPGPRS
jgi:hypothetical protein